MKITILILLIIICAIFPDAWIGYPFFVAYCFPLKYNNGLYKYLNISFNLFSSFLMLYLSFYFISVFLPSNSRIMFFPKIYNLTEFVFFLPLSIFLLLFLKYVYKYSINWLDIVIHILSLLFINYFSEPLAILLIKRGHFRAFTMSINLLFIFFSLYCIWKVHQQEKEIV